MIMLTLSPLGCFLSQVDEDIRPWALSSDIVNILSTYLEHGPKKILSPLENCNPNTFRFQSMVLYLSDTDW